MLFCPSFTQSERFLQTDQLVTRLQVVVMTNFIRMLMRNVIVNVFKSDAVIWWAAILHTPSSRFDKLLHLSKSQGSAMSRSTIHDLREAICDLLTVTMCLQDTLSKFHRPGLHKVDLCVQTLHFTNPRAAELSVHSTIIPGEQLLIMLHWSLVAIPSQAPPTSAISSDSPELRQTMFCFLEDAYTDTTCFQQNP